MCPFGASKRAVFPKERLLSGPWGLSAQGKCADFPANFRRMQGKDLQAYLPYVKILNVAEGEAGRKSVRLV